MTLDLRAVEARLNADEPGTHAEQDADISALLAALRELRHVASRPVSEMDDNDFLAWYGELQAVLAKVRDE
jgi:hypothetical protein